MMAEKGNKKKKILFTEPIKSVRKRGKSIIQIMLVGPGLILIGGIIIFIYFFLNPVKGEDPFCVLYLSLPMGIFGLLLFYFLEYKKIKRFIIFDDGFTKGYGLTAGPGDNYIYFSDVKYFRIDHYVSKKQPPVIHVYYNDFGEIKRTWIGGWSEKKMKQVEKIFMEKGIPRKKRKWYE